MMNNKRVVGMTVVLILMQQVCIPIHWFTGTELGGVQATYLQDDNAGKFELSFLNPEGIVQREGLIVTGGTMFFSENTLTGKFLSMQIEPASMRYRDKVSLDTTTPSGSKFFLTLLDCESQLPLSGWERLPYTGQSLSLTSIDKAAATCLQVQVEVERTDVQAPSPIISKLALEYQPYPVLVSKVSPITPKVEACSNVHYQVNFTNNYVNDMGVILYVPLPRAEAGTITGYDESLDLYPRLNPIFVNAGGGGKYTTTGIIINNKEIPAESVYRDIGVLNAGETRMYGVTLNVPCDTMNNTKYLVTSTIAGVLADATTSTQAEVTIFSQARPKLTKTAQGVFTYANKNYVYLPYNSTLTYSITTSNPQGTEAINKPVITDDVTDLQTTFSTQCTGASLAERIYAISDGGVLSGTRLTWNLANIARNQNKSVSYQVNFSGCNEEATLFTTTAHLTAKNISSLSAQYTIQLLTLLSPGVQYFKTLLNTNGAIYYGDVITYQLHLTNI
ncbi:MAG: hypothetical protein LBD75_06335 [Candidatus Peribacteria bacterium]|jgi:hypothetical protein|nr:hypothetical protein [Candidatus Peribacteria bacterium]